MFQSCSPSYPVVYDWARIVLSDNTAGFFLDGFRHRPWLAQVGVWNILQFGYIVTGGRLSLDNTLTEVYTVKYEQVHNQAIQ
jgi:hypothetical protein